MAEQWVVNASPLITLSKAGQLELLQADNRRLVIPEAVRAEVFCRGRLMILHGKPLNQVSKRFLMTVHLNRWYSNGGWVVVRLPYSALRKRMMRLPCWMIARHGWRPR